MCAYNVRHSRRVDHDPPSGQALTRNRIRALAIWAFGVLVLAGLFGLVRQYFL